VTRDREFRNLTSMLIPKDKFIDDNNGTLFIDLRYNIAKSLFEPTNPIQLEFRNVDVNSTDAYSIAEGRDSLDPHIPRGYRYLGDIIKNFYCSRVSPDKRNYPNINFNNVAFVRTPMQIEIFCGINVDLKYCMDKNLTNHTIKSSSPRAQSGWFISIDHNRSVDGDVIELIPDSNDPNVLTFSTISNPTFPIQFPKGRNGTVTTKFTNPVGVQSYKVFMHPSPQHR